MTARTIRRAAERKAKKAARKAAAHQANQTLHSVEPQHETMHLEITVSPAPPVDELETSRPASQAQIDANRANAKLSTGPKSDAGKAISSQNRRCHGLAGAFQLMPWEDAEAFAILQNDLRQHYSPVNIVEQGYVDRLAEHMWLRQRCLDLQVYCFDPECELRRIGDEKQFALLARYQNQNERGIDRCVNQLLKLQTARRKEQNGFESEIRKQAAETRKNEAHAARLRLTNARSKAIEVNSDIRQTCEVRLPGNMHVPFNELAGAFRGAIREVSEEIEQKQEAA